MLSTGARADEIDRIMQLQYKAGRYIDCASSLQIYSATGAKTSRRDRVLYALANIHLARGEYDDALKLFDSLHRQFPGSLWTRDALEKAGQLLKSQGRWMESAQYHCHYLSSLLPDISYDLYNPRCLPVMDDIRSLLTQAGQNISDASLPVWFMENCPDTALSYASTMQQARGLWWNGNRDGACDLFLKALEFKRIPGNVLYSRAGILDETAPAEISREQLMRVLVKTPDAAALEKLFLNRKDLSGRDPVFYECSSRDITVDGDLSDWEGVPVFCMDRDSYITSGESGGFEDFSVYFRAVWNSQFLFVMVRVLDDVHVQLNNDVEDLHKGDSIIISAGYFYDSLGRIEINSPDSEFNYAWHSHKRLYEPSWPPVLSQPDFKHTVIRRSAQECVYEMALPWEKLADPSGIQPGFNLRFNLAANDDDSKSPECTMKWTPRAKDYHPLGLGRLILR